MSVSPCAGSTQVLLGRLRCLRLVDDRRCRTAAPDDPCEIGLSHQRRHRFRQDSTQILTQQRSAGLAFEPVADGEGGHHDGEGGPRWSRVCGGRSAGLLDRSWTSASCQLDGELSAVRHPLVMLSSSSACPIVASDTYRFGTQVGGHPNPRAGDHGLARFTTSKLAINQVPDVLHARLGPATGARSRPVDQRRLRSWVWLPSRS